MFLTASTRDAGKRLDAFLHERLPEYSRSRLQSWIKQNRVTVDGHPARASALLHGTEIIAVDPAELKPLRAQAEDLPLQIVYEDDEVVVVDKPAGMVVHAGAGHPSGTLVNALLHHFGSLSSLNGDLRPGIVHRLDRETSGLLVVARTDRAHQSLARQFHDRTVGKSYLALAHGIFQSPAGTITLPIARDPVRRSRMTTRIASGRSALTDYRVLEAFEKFSYLAVRIGTGRTHQIRVHLSSLHHPIAGDRLYGAPPLSPLPDRFFLHAHRLAFHSPVSGEPMSFESPLPAELAQVLAALRSQHG